MSNDSISTRRRLAEMKRPQPVIDLPGAGGSSVRWAAISGVHSDTPASGDTRFTGRVYADPYTVDAVPDGLVTIVIPGYEGTDYPAERFLVHQFYSTWTGAAESHTEYVYGGNVFTWWGDAE